MAKQFLNPGFERENEYECLQCKEAITNPLCHDCLSNGIIQWVSSYPDVKKKMQPKIKQYVKEVDNLVTNSINCVSCSKKKAALCPYCFTEGILNMLKKDKIDKAVIGDFLSIFNFDLMHEGYIAEAIKEHLY